MTAPLDWNLRLEVRDCLQDDHFILLSVRALLGGQGIIVTQKLQTKNFKALEKGPKISLQLLKVKIVITLMIQTICLDRLPYWTRIRKKKISSDTVLKTD